MRSHKLSRTRKSLRADLGFLGDHEVATILGIEVATLRNRRSRGDAPASSKVGADHLTAQADLLAFIARRKVAA